jgi:hypothetical protein
MEDAGADAAGELWLMACSAKAMIELFAASAQFHSGDNYF